MSFELFLDQCLRSGVTFSLEDGELFVDADDDIPAALMADIKARKSEIIAWIRTELDREGRAARQAVRPIVRDGARFPLSFAQQRLWVIDQLNGGSAQYNMPMALHVSGSFDETIAEQAFGRIIARHEPLRTVFSGDDAQYVQLVRDPAPFSIRRIDLRSLPNDQQAAMVEEAALADARTPFDLRSDVMLRATFIRQSGQEGVLLFNMHHIASDGWSMGLLIDEFVQHYSACTAGAADPLPPLDVQYVDYAHWQRHWLVGEVLESQLDYWTRQLADLPAVHALPLDRPRPAQQQFDGARHELGIAPATHRGLQKLAKDQHVTMFMLLHACVSILLARHGNSTDIVVGSPVVNRPQKELQGLIGFFANTLVLRTDCSGNPRFVDFLAAVKAVNLDAQENQSIPFEYLVERLNPARSTQYGPLFQVVFNMDTNNAGAVALDNVKFTPLVSKEVSAKFELNFNVSETTQGLLLGIDYSTALFDAETIASLADHLGNLLKSVIASPTAPVHSLAMLGEAEQRKLMGADCANYAAFPQRQCLHELFEAQAARTPDNVAVVFGDASLSYAELNARANRLAHYLRASGVQADSLVGLCVERGLDMLVGLLGILKAGGAYVPLDPAYPHNRLAYIVQDSAMRMLLTEQSLATKVEQLVDGAEVVVEQMDGAAFQQRLAQYPDVNLAPCATPSSLAYIIYTSGSTGQPKGVMIEHANVGRLFDASAAKFHFDASDTWTLFHSYGFDFSVWEIWGALLHGGRLVVVPHWVARSASDFYALLCKEGVTVLNQTPSAFAALVAVDAQEQAQLSLRYVIFGGEALNIATLAPWVGRHGDAAPQLVNMYGITETTVHVTYRRLTVADIDNTLNPSVIGSALPDLSSLILTPALSLAPQGVTGELHIGGAGLARGYLNRPELTAQRFIANPFHDPADPHSSERLYKTGDLVRCLADGSLEYIGRIDDQVKIRGFRIELGEIENSLAQHAEVASAVVLAREDIPGDKRLVAYVTLQGEGGEGIAGRLAAHLQAGLPEYMVPALYVVLDSLPLTANGKVDKKALPAPDAGQLQGEYVAPSTPTEQAVAAIWADVLRLDAGQVSTTSNFFQLGGHSLLVIQILSRLQEAGLATDVRTVFGAPTLGALAAALDAAGGRGAAFVAPPNLIPAGCTRITPEMLPLVALRQDEIDAVAAAVPGGHANVQDIYPLAPLQEGILFHHLMHEDNDPYIMPVLMTVETQAQLNDFMAALQVVVNRHDVLRTAIVSKSVAKAVQVVWKEAQLQFVPLDLDPAREAYPQLLERCAAPQSMDISVAPLLRASYAQESSTGRYFVFLQLHHLIDDATSLRKINEEVIAILAGNTSLPVPVPYREFIAHALHLAESHDAETYFKANLGDLDEPTAPYNLLNVHGDGSTIVEVKKQLEPAMAARIRTSARDYKVSPATMFHAAWALVVAACSGRDDVVFGTVLSGRLQGTAGAANMLGMFINTLPLRLKLQGKNVREVIEQTETSLRELLPYEQASLALAQRCSALSASVPLFSAMLNYRHSARPAEGPDVGDTQHGIAILSMSERTNYPFNVSIDDLGEGFAIDAQIHYSVDASRIVGYIEQALAAILDALGEESTVPVLSLPVVPAAEQVAVLAAMNAVPKNYPQERCLHELFEAQAARTPDNVAVVFGDASMSYAELNARANRLAHYLRASGVQADSLVGLCVERGLDMLVGLLGILKAGGAYVPLDPAYPHNRLAYIVQDSAMRMLLTEQSLATKVEQLVDGAEVVVEQMDGAAFQQRLAQYPDVNLAPCATPSSLAYIIYTSGSTGQPKGVMIEHANVGRLFDASAAKFHFDASDTWTLFHSYGFDFSVWEIWGALLHGGRLVVVPHWVARSASDFYALLCKEGVTVLNQTPSAFAALVAVDAQEQAQLSLRYVIFGGEALNIATLAPWVGRHGDAAPQLVNMYGITETTVHVTYRRLTVADIDNTLNPSVIGSALPDLSSLILTPALSLAPQGVTGELHIGGAGLARGYLNRPELTAQRFIANPFHDPADPHSSERLYKTGDLVRCLADGSLEYIGRIDDQVKIRGFRIELGEIENSLAQHAEVASAVVLAREDIPGDKRLVAYVTLQGEGGEGIAGRLAAHLQAGLPEYMVPALYVVLDSLPLTANGKVDKKALPAPDAGQLQGEYVAPSTPTEQAVAAIWADVLRLDAGQVSTTSNFFQMGGHSLLVIQILSRLQEAGLATDVRTVFGAPTLGALAAALDAAGGRGAAFVAPPNLIPAGCTRITPEMLPLVALSQEEIDRVVAAVPGGHANVQDIYPLAPLQEGILFHHLMQSENDPYIMPVLLALDSEAHLNRFLLALQTIVDRHDVLRTAIVAKAANSAVQVVLRQAGLRVKTVELDPALDPQDQLFARMTQAQWMDLADAPLLQASTARDPHSPRCFIMLQLHHIISDHIGLEVIQAEVLAHMAGKATPLNKPTPYREFIAHTLHQAQTNNAEAFFLAQLADVDEHTAPFSLLDVHGDGSAIIEVRQDVKPALAKRIRESARNHKVSPATLFHAAWALVLAACSGRDDVVFGTVLSGRLQGTTGAAHMLGMFINTLPMRLKLQGRTAAELIVQTEAGLRELLPYEQASLALAQRCSALPGGMPLFSAMLNYRHSAPVPGSDPAEEASLGVSILRMSERTNYPFNVSIDDLGEGFAIDAQIHYSVDASRIVGYIEQALAAILDALGEESTVPVLSLPVVPAAEQAAVLAAMNAVPKTYPQERCLHELFEAQAARTPDNVAVVFGDASLSYAELNARANRLAHYLRASGVQADSLVGLCVERGLDMLVGLLGILKAGGAYVPLDPAYPHNRLAYIVQDSAMRMLLTEQSLATKVEQLVDDAEVVVEQMDGAAFQQRLAQYPDVNLAPCATPSSLAYIIYTSGSTGQPKGVMIEHANVGRLFDASAAKFHFDASDTWTLFHSYGFDFSVWEIWGALLHGGRLVVVPHWVARSASDFYALLCKEGVTVLNQTPSAFAALVAVDAQEQAQLSLRYVIFGGEALNIATLAPWVGRHGDAAPQLVNMYGITETTVHVTYRRLTVADIDNTLNPSVIGSALPDLSSLILTPALSLAPQGVTGELHIGGAGLARGYLNRPELTAQRFIANPFHDPADPHSSERLYKTGDLVRCLADGSLEYIGRIDDQVKIRGFRIELGEIENSLAQHAEVASAVVLAREDIPGDKRLVAYVTLQGEGGEGIAGRLAAHLQAGLPEYMVPALYVVLDSLPLTANGKVDKKALPAPDAGQLQGEYVAPSTPTEQAVAAIWADVLRLDAGQVSTTSNFFQLGGHSLLVIQILSRLQEAGLATDVRTVFGAPTLGALAAALDAAGGRGAAFVAPPNLIPAGCTRITPEMLPLVALRQDEIDAVAAAVPGGHANVQDIYPLAPLQEGILFHHLIQDGSDPYILPVLLSVESEAQMAAFIRAIQAVVDRHDVLRTAIISRTSGTALQVVHRRATVPVQALSLEDGKDAEAQLMERISAPQWMDLAKAPLLQVATARDPRSGRHFLMLQLHHIISDHIGLDIVQDEIMQHLCGKFECLDASIPYRNFVAHALHQAANHDAEAFFTQTLGDVSEPTAPFRLRDVHGDGSAIVEVRRELDAGLARLVRETARANSVSPATLFHAAWAMVVSACSGRDDVVFGTVLSGRLQGTSNASRMLGMFINTLPLRLRLGGVGIVELVEQTESALRELLNHEQASLALAQRCSALPGGEPLFSAMLNYRHSEAAQAPGPEVVDTGVKFISSRERTNYPFNVSIDDLGEGFAIDAQIRRDVDAHRIVSYLEQAVGGLVEGLRSRSDHPVTALPVLPESERDFLLKDLSGAAAWQADRRCIHELFEAQAAALPDAIAAVTDEASITYGELNARANQLAHYLVEQGVDTDCLVGLCVERSLDMLVALLGILKAGGAYVPLDAAYPQERLAYMIKDSGMDLLLTQESLAHKFSQVRIETLDGGALQADLKRRAAFNPARRPGRGAANLAYVIYTSGSTGQPKGVMVEHRGVVRLVSGANYVPFNRDTVLLHMSSISFDAATMEIWGALLNGGKVVLYAQTHTDLAAINALLDRHEVNTAWFTSALFDQWSLQLPAGGSLRWILAGGDVVNPLTVQRVQAAMPDAVIINGYGPTENTTFTCCHAIAPVTDTASSIPLGKAIKGTTTYVLDDRLRLVPFGVAGELCVGGDGLARGYLKLPDLTAERFIDNPYAPGRLYKTGDMVRYLADGTLEYLGRKDDQVKIRGFRIELGEIETRLQQYAGVSACLVMAREDVPGDKRLAAYIVGNGDYTRQQLRAHLQALLPDYMVPASYVLLDAFPLTSNGKVDTHALAAPDASHLQADFVAPASDTERVLAQMWGELLAMAPETISTTANFFELGGHSLLAIRFVAAVNATFPLDIGIKAIFNLTTIGAIAELIDDRLKQEAVNQKFAALQNDDITEIEI